MQIGQIDTATTIFSGDYWLPLSVAVPFVFGLLFMPVYISVLKKFQVQQYLREEGPKSHAHKAKTPTAGGVVFIFGSFAGLIVLILCYLAKSALPPVAGVLPQPVTVCFGVHASWLVFAAAFACGLLGFADDFAKVQQKSNRGVSPQSRLIVEAIIGVLLAAGLIYFCGPIQILLPGFSAVGFWLSPHAMPAIISVPLSVFLVMATTNAVNIHDGMDGLAAGTCALTLSTMALMLTHLALASVHHLPVLSLAFLSMIVVSSLVSFLLFNHPPKHTQHSDTGSLFLGGLLGGLALASGTLIFFVPLTLIYIAEVMSVLIQTSYFKLTKPYTPEKPMSKLALALFKLRHKLPGEGKRVFRMAPLHHHYEMVAAEKGIRENQLVALFWLAQAALCVLVWLAFQHMQTSIWQ